MLRLVSVSVVALALAFGAPAFSATDATLPGPVSTSLAGATSAADIAALVLAYPDLAATIMAQAAVLGIASPVQVLSAAISPSSSTETILTLVGAAAEATPGQADLLAATAFSAAGGGDDLAAIIAAAVIDGVEASGASPEVVASAAAEIVATLQELAGAGAEEAIAQAAADATDTPDDSATSLQAAAEAILTDGTETTEVGDESTESGDESTTFVQPPSESQNNPSDN